VHLRTICVSISKVEPKGEVIISDTIPLAFGHSINCPYVSSFLHIQGRIELNYYLLVPIKHVTHLPLDMFSLTCSNDLVEDWIILFFHMLPINPLEFRHDLFLGSNDHGLVEVLLKKSVKLIISDISL
jgi:hypothetical protein